MSDLIGRLWELAEDVEMALSQAGAEIPYLRRQLAETRAHLAEANAALTAMSRCRTAADIQEYRERASN